MAKTRKWHIPLTEDWQRRLTALLTLVFVMQFVSWFASEENMWWPETVTIVRLSLVVVFALELLPRVNFWLLRCIQLWILIIANALFSGYEPVWYKVRSFTEFGNWTYDNFWQLHPFIWFSLGAWLIYVTAEWWMRVRWRIATVTVASVLVLAARDSFSLLVLWEETAVIILCGLLLLIVCHFGEIKRQNPSGWAYLIEYPATLLIMVIAVLGIMMTPGILMPTVRPLLTDPYTAYLQWKGEPVPSLGKSFFGAGVFSSGSSSSGYSRDDSSLGGGFDYDYSPVFTVDTTHRSYWRGETRALYTGDGWELNEGDRQGSSGAVALNTPLIKDPRFNTNLLQTVKVTQTITMLNEDASYPVLFGAFAIGQVNAVNGAGADRLRWSARQSELRFNEGGRNNNYPESYVIESEMPVISGEELRKVASPPNMAAFSEYLQLPRSLPPRVRQLAQTVTASGASPYEKAKLLEKYLQESFPYTSKPRTELAASSDFVDSFLFEIKEGYCDYFSSAMAVLSRTVGIPSRWVKGYVSGYNQLDDLSFGQVPLDVMDNPDGPGLYTVRNSDAHSWVELYFHGYGWIPFEATSGFVIPLIQPEEEAVDTVLPEVDASVEPAAAPVDGEASGLSRGAVITLSLTGVLMAAAAVLGWIFRRKLAQLPGAKWLLTGKRAINPRQKIISEYSRLLRIFRRKGFAVAEYETARETVVRLKQQHKWMSEDLERLLALFEKAKYSTGLITHEECGKAIEIVNKLKKAV
ncbi:MAG: hypothetical protein K0R57_5674 [Paenibacillaceae bacterium]|jgi:hypothetical protein|nr:hypothetical protein [Paenibacillaceae bacterium]